MVTTIRLPDELHKQLKTEAEVKGITFNAYVLMILWKEVKNDELKHSLATGDGERDSGSSGRQP